jgi:hypothetical protein
VKSRYLKELSNWGATLKTPSQSGYMRVNKPNLSPVCQSDKSHFRFQWKCVNTCGKYRCNSLFFENSRLNQNKTC